MQVELGPAGVATTIAVPMSIRTVVAAALAASSAMPLVLQTADFDPQAYLLYRHCEHAPDKGEGQSAATDRTRLESLYGRQRLSAQAVAVSGAYGLDADDLNPDSVAVMEAAFGEIGGRYSAHRDWHGTVTALADRWRTVITAGGPVCLKEGANPTSPPPCYSGYAAQCPNNRCATGCR